MSASRDEYLAARARQYREQAIVRQELVRLPCGPREVVLTLAQRDESETAPWVELAVWAPTGAPSEGRRVERGRVQMYPREVDALIAKLHEALKRLAEVRRG